MTAGGRGRWRARGRGPGHPRRVGEAGFGLLELMIAMTIGIVVIGLVLVSVTSFLQTGYNGVATGQANDKLALALTFLRRQVTAADIIYNPTKTTAAGVVATATKFRPGFSVRLLTTATGSTTCVQWRLLPTGHLQERSWPTNAATTARWKTMATSLVNATATAPFVLDPTSAYGGRVLQVDLVIRTTRNAKTTVGPTTIESSFTALDAEFYVPTAPQFCSPPTPTPAP